MLARIRKQLEEKDDKGFTLVELLVVIIIIGILAAIAIPLYLSQQNKAKDSAAKADLATVRTAVVSAMTEDPSGLVVAWTAAVGPNTSTISVDGNDVAEVGISNDNSLAAGTATIAAETISISITSPTGNVFTIDENGTVTETAPAAG
ncbi:prepilin-type N-terminal cleavage/methylation domain-containing protein [Demequina sp. SYSU T00039]|uniref:Prepilin-type N-terminal cleavage/methylation domain-containing protein n=1 Tax=Demequina lignilytica TaxID=3051663 RepID=A0AAW7M845_9MICO|nr:prepilin-type N-terminal cleavage/methylation domain-containing protein [Demequina sp. SYSU T00039]MDN4486711.1 prepilin-type N-terminal cleavage/methylation domain-containing protein [Demequina sp. SYSU T00039]